MAGEQQDTSKVQELISMMGVAQIGFPLGEAVEVLARADRELDALGVWRTRLNRASRAKASRVREQASYDVLSLALTGRRGAGEHVLEPECVMEVVCEDLAAAGDFETRYDDNPYDALRRAVASFHLATEEFAPRALADLVVKATLALHAERNLLVAREKVPGANRSRR